MMSIRRFPSVVLVLGVLVVGCNNDNNSPVAPTTPSAITTELFSGNLAVRGSSFYSFTTLQKSAVRLTLASLTAPTSHPALTTVVGLGIGVPSGIDCAMTSSVNTSAGLTAQVANEMNPGTYCARIFDVGSLTAPADFAIRIEYPDTPPTSTGAKTETFASSVGIQGAASRSFTSSIGGTVTVRLENVNPTPGVVVGIGLGVPRLDGSGCSLGRSVNTGAGAAPQLTSGIDSGTYCVKIYDVGNFTSLVNFTITIVHP